MVQPFGTVVSVRILREQGMSLPLDYANDILAGQVMPGSPFYEMVTQKVLASAVWRQEKCVNK